MITRFMLIYVIYNIMIKRRLTLENIVNYQKHQQGYGVIFINRPEKRNAISLEVADKLIHYLDKALNDSLKFLVIKTAGDKIFCAGGDLNDFHGELQENEAYAILSRMKEVLYKIATFPVPTISLLQGNALGGGCELATSCDFRIAKEGTKFGFVQTNLGILPGWGGGAILYDKVQPNFAFHWLMQAEMYPASYLQDQGWIQQVVPANEWGNEEDILKPFLKKSNDQMHYLKSQFTEETFADQLHVKMDKEVRRCAKLWNSKEHQEIVQSFLQKK